MVLNTHFPHEQETDFARVESAQLVIRQLGQIAPEPPHIVMADFNAKPGSAAYQVFRVGGYVDVATGSDTEISTYHGYQGAAFPHSGLRIDWILVKARAQQLIPKRYTVIMDAQPPLYPSDHYPLLADLELG